MQKSMSLVSFVRSVTVFGALELLKYNAQISFVDMDVHHGIVVEECYITKRGMT